MDFQNTHKFLYTLKTLDAKIENLALSCSKKHEYRSMESNELFTALAKAQGEMGIAGLSNDNPFFKSRYADLATIVKASRPALTKHGLSVLQQVMINDKGQNILSTVLAHASGQWISSQIIINPIKNDVQSFGSYLTYLRRYSYAALVGVITCDEDDDAESAMGRGNKAAKDLDEKISSVQLHQLQHELQGYPHIEEEIMEKMKLKKLADFPKAKFAASIEKIKILKNNTI